MKALKIIGIILGIILLLFIIAGTYIKTALPDTGSAPDITIKATPERVEQGKYLANHVAVCMDCHSTRRWDLFAGPMSETAIGGGGEVFNEKMGFPGTFYAPNITPYSLGKWTDGEIFRAITTGVNKNGKALFPLMAYHRFGKMDKEDIYNIIAYIKTLSPVKKDIQESKTDFPVSLLINTMPKRADFQKKPSADNTIAYGGYLVNAAGCVDCHSNQKNGAVVLGTEFGGGMAFIQPNGTVRSPNITADDKTGIGKWTEKDFVSRFKLYGDASYRPAEIPKNGLNTPMPWVMYSGMKETDLAAMYVYLKSLKPIKNKIITFERNK